MCTEFPISHITEECAIHAVLYFPHQCVVFSLPKLFRWWIKWQVSDCSRSFRLLSPFCFECRRFWRAQISQLKLKAQEFKTNKQTNSLQKKKKIKLLRDTFYVGQQEGWHHNQVSHHNPVSPDTFPYKMGHGNWRRASTAENLQGYFT